MSMSHKDLARKFVVGATKYKGNNMFIDGDTIYSYGKHFAIAKRINEKGYTEYIVNASKYSVSTCKHQLIVRKAIRGAALVGIPTNGHYELKSPPVWECPKCDTDNIPEWLMSETKETYKKLLRARLYVKYYVEKLACIESYWRKCKERFNLKCKELDDLFNPELIDNKVKAKILCARMDNRL